MCADDSTLYISGNNITTVQHKLQDDMTNINMWCDANNMTVNPTKSTCMLIGSTHRVEHVSLDLHINSTPITEVHTQKLLGIFVNKHLKWDKQIDWVNQAPIYIINLITVSDNSHYGLQSNRKKQLVHVRPNTDYLKQSIQFITAIVWNRIPQYVKNSKSIYTFKSSFKKFLQTNTNLWTVWCCSKLYRYRCCV